ncbi:hypothetical protein BH10CHL1_BH10CHL1_25560 [soil metagenome]
MRFAEAGKFNNTINKSLAPNNINIEDVGVIDPAAVSAQPQLTNANTTTQNMSNTANQPLDSSKGSPSWAILPALEYLRVEGVRAFARVGRYPANVKAAHQVINAHLQ